MHGIEYKLLEPTITLGPCDRVQFNLSLSLFTVSHPFVVHNEPLITNTTTAYGREVIRPKTMTTVKNISSAHHKVKEETASSLRAIDPEVLRLAIACSSQSTSSQKSKRFRPYTAVIQPGPDTNFNSGAWTEEEHDKFLKGYKQYGRRWKLISQLFVQTRSRSQVAAHAQKYFAKLKNSEISE